MNEEIIKKLACPYDHSEIFLHTGSYFECEKCHRHFPVKKDGIVDFLPDNLRCVAAREGDLSGAAGGSFLENTGKWRPGLRYWIPGFLAKTVSSLRCRGTGRLLDRQAGMIMLDVGCGGSAQGDVNVDVYIPQPIPKNFILASAELLPFKDNSFDIVRSAYVIEHNLLPTEMIKEHFRVSSQMVKTYTDNSDWVGAIVLRILNTGFIFHDEHYFKWSKEYFSNLIDRLGFDGTVSLFNSSPSLIVKLLALLGRLPRIGPVFYRDLYVEIVKISQTPIFSKTQKT